MTRMIPVSLGVEGGCFWAVERGWGPAGRVGGGGLCLQGCSQGGDYRQFPKGSIFNISAETLNHPHSPSCGPAGDPDARAHPPPRRPPDAQARAPSPACPRVSHTHTCPYTLPHAGLSSSPAALGMLEFDLLYDQASCTLHCSILRAKVGTPGLPSPGPVCLFPGPQVGPLLLPPTAIPRHPSS